MSYIQIKEIEISYDFSHAILDCLKNGHYEDANLM